jgi:hypothetical protein
MEAANVTGRRAAQGHPRSIGIARIARSDDPTPTALPSGTLSSESTRNARERAAESLRRGRDHPSSCSCSGFEWRPDTLPGRAVQPRSGGRDGSPELSNSPPRPALDRASISAARGLSGSDYDHRRSQAERKRYDDIPGVDKQREQLRLRGPLLQSANGEVSTSEIDARQALASERQESCRPTRQRLPICLGDAALQNRRRLAQLHR